MNEREEGVTPFLLAIHPDAAQDIRDAIEWLLTMPFSESSESGGETAAQRFAEMIERELPALCLRHAESLATGMLTPRPDAEASETFRLPQFAGGPVYRELIFTGRRKRGSAAGGWRVFYALSSSRRPKLVSGMRDGDDGDLDLDTLTVLAVLHAAGGPLQGRKS